MPTLYTHPMSTFAQRIHIALREKKVEWTPAVVDMAKGAHKAAEYLAINPYGRVPTLEDGAMRVCESTAILEYLEERHPEPPLMPADPVGRAQMRMHVKLCDLEFAGRVGTIIFPKRFLPRERWDQARMDAAKAGIERHLAILDTHLATRTFLAGEIFTQAEVAYAPFLLFLPLMEIEPPEHVREWATELLARSSVVETRPADAPDWPYG